jgi:hypothetical protein
MARRMTVGQVPAASNVIPGKLPVFGVQQPVQTDAHLLGDAGHVVEVGHRRGHAKTIPHVYDTTP